jgi:hypothetical protein
MMKTTEQLKRETLGQCADLIRFRHYAPGTEKDYCLIIVSFEPTEAGRSARAPFLKTA